MDENENEDSAPEFRGRCEDAPCCGCCGQVEFEQFDPEMDEMRDFEVGNCWRGDDEEGCDEDDEEPCEEGGEDRHLDSFWESQTECDFGGGDW
jgi:hypothetical protein